MERLVEPWFHQSFHLWHFKFLKFSLKRTNLCKTVVTELNLHERIPLVSIKSPCSRKSSLKRFEKPGIVLVFGIQGFFGSNFENFSGTKKVVCSRKTFRSGARAASGAEKRFFWNRRLFLFQKSFEISFQRTHVLLF